MCFTVLAQGAVDHADYTWMYTGSCFPTGILSFQLDFALQPHSATVRLYSYTVGDDTNNICFHTSHLNKSKEMPGLRKNSESSYH